ncbi:MAG: ribbon-helix-helix domain-containing protein [Acetobacter sp.]|nr:ribbon-helix-helix domain-containing protein [Acetobacter sp.]
MIVLTNKIIYITNKKTSMRLASAEWLALDSICKKERVKRNYLIELIKKNKDTKMGLTSAVRLFTLIYFYHLLIDKKQNYASPIYETNTPIYDAIGGIL